MNVYKLTGMLKKFSFSILADPMIVNFRNDDFDEMFLNNLSLWLMRLIHCVLYLGESFSDSEDFEDDIILTKAQKALIDNPDGPLYHDSVDLETSAAMVLWPENTVPYYVPPELG